MTLQFTTYAVRLARGYMFPPGATPEEQAAQSGVWNAVVFWSALFYHLPLLAHLEGELVSGKLWRPGMSSPGEAFRFTLQTATSAGFRGTATGSGDGRATVAGGGDLAGHCAGGITESGGSGQYEHTRRWH
ncbi:TraI domain-containing protein [Escherichia coli]